MTPSFNLAVSLPLQTLMMIGAAGSVVIVSLAYFRWRLAVKAAFIILLVEGAIRKWFFASGQELVYFLKDVVLFGAYLRFYLSPEPALRGWRIRAPHRLILLLCAIVSLSALNPNIGSPLLAIYGIKVYLYYIPLAFMVPFLWRSQEQMFRELTWYALLAIPICILGLIQSRVGGDSPLNVYAIQNPDEAVAGFAGTEYARVTGTFSYLTGHTTFLIFFTALHIALLLTDVKKIYWWLLVLDLPLLLGNALAGGSRASIFAMALVVVGFIASSLFTKVSRGKNVIFILGIGSIVALIGTMIFFAAAAGRWMGRYETSGTVAARVYEGPLQVLPQAMAESGVLGYGIGMTHPAVSALRNALKIPLPRQRPPTYDFEAAQVLVELGYVGMIAWYILRFMVVWQTFSSFKNCPPGPLRPLLLAALLVELPHLMMGVVLNHTANFLLFGCYGLALILRVQKIQGHSMRAVPRGQQLTPAQASSRFPRRS